MMIYHDKIEKKKILIAMHTHDSEQFGYRIKSGFIIVEDGKGYEISTRSKLFCPTENYALQIFEDRR